MSTSHNFPANLREARERKKYLAGHKESIVSLLRQEVNPGTGDLKDPFEVFTGVGEVSVIYLLTSEYTGHFKDYVAKFELKGVERFRHEISATERLKHLAIPSSILMPVAHKNPEPETKTPGIILYEAAQNFSGSGRVAELQQLLQGQLGTNRGNCLRALTLVDEQLRLLHRHSPGAFDTKTQNGQAITWAHFFRFKPEAGEALRFSADFAYAPIRWREDPTASIILDRTRLPNPITELDARLRRSAGRLRLSLVHGDLNPQTCC